MPLLFASTVTLSLAGHCMLFSPREACIHVKQCPVLCYLEHILSISSSVVCPRGHISLCLLPQVHPNLPQHSTLLFRCLLNCFLWLDGRYSLIGIIKICLGCLRFHMVLPFHQYSHSHLSPFRYLFFHLPPMITRIPCLPPVWSAVVNLAPLIQSYSTPLSLTYYDVNFSLL